jgi:anthranilate synthase component I
MKKIELYTTCKRFLADIYTPVGIYLRLRDRFRDTILLESTDFHAGENSYSFIGVNAIGGIEAEGYDEFEYKLPGRQPSKINLGTGQRFDELLWMYMNMYEVQPGEAGTQFAQGLFGYTSYDAVPFFEPKAFGTTRREGIPLIRYRLYQYVIAINHFKDELLICENHVPGVESELHILEALVKSKDVPLYPFRIKGQERSSITDEAYKEMVRKGIASCMRGDVFQIVLSRKYEQAFTGDEFNVYRSLRNVNPSPYLFYFDYGDYKLMGSSPESQVIIRNRKAIVHPIAGTIKRSGNDETDAVLATTLLNDVKEKAEHTMLVDLARNDLSRVCTDVKVDELSEIQYYSHVIHMTSKVSGTLTTENPFAVLAATFPAGTLSGAPKHRAMQLINEYEPTARGFYGGCIGYAGFDGVFNHAIMIRSMLSRNNTLSYQAGAGVVAASKPENELQEVTNKLAALKNAIDKASDI